MLCPLSGQIGGKIAEYIRTGKNDGVIHWRSDRQGPLLPQVIESLSHLSLTEEKLVELFLLGSIYSSEGRLTSWKIFETDCPAQTYLRIHTLPRRHSLEKIDWQNRVHFENSDFLIFEKPSQIPCHPMVDNSQENLLVGLETHFQKKFFLTHRLDIATEGLIVFAKTPKFQSFFNQALIQRKVQKRYYAITETSPPWEPGTTLTHHMVPSPRAPKELLTEAGPGTLECRLNIVEKSGCLLTIDLLTGRTHQIRAQLSFSGFPIVGDQAYGARTQPWGKDNIALQAFEISFPAYPDPNEENFWHFKIPLSKRYGLQI